MPDAHNGAPELGREVEDEDRSEHSKGTPSEELQVERVRAEFSRIRSKIDDLETRLGTRLNRAVAPGGFFSSGLFFILLGIAFLIIASRYMGSEHSSFSFVTVVLGVGILLYGTGSQGVGEYKFKSNYAGVINVAIVGGAAVITFCVAFGMIYFQNEIKTAFQIERKYFVLRIEPNDDGSSKFDNYVANFRMNGMDITVVRSGHNIIVYVPYLESDKRSKPRVEYEFFHVGPPSADGGLERKNPAVSKLRSSKVTFLERTLGWTSQLTSRLKLSI